MKRWKCAGFLAVVLIAAFVMPSAAFQAGRWIEFSSLDAQHPYKVSGTLYLPENAASPVPAIVLVHGTAGIDRRGQLYRRPLLDAGIGIFEVDFLRASNTDNGTSSAAGFAVKSNYRVSEIDANVNGTWVRRYALGYAAGDNGTTALLSSITASGLIAIAVW